MPFKRREFGSIRSAMLLAEKDPTYSGGSGDFKIEPEPNWVVPTAADAAYAGGVVEGLPVNPVVVPVVQAPDDGKVTNG